MGYLFLRQNTSYDSCVGSGSVGTYHDLAPCFFTLLDAYHPIHGPSIALYTLFQYGLLH